MPAGLEDVVKPNHIALDVRIRVLYAVPHARLRRKVHDNVEVVFLEQVVNKCLVSQVTLDETECMLRMLRRLGRNLPQPVLLQRRVVIVVEIVQPDNPERFLALQQPQDQIRPDKPGCAGDEKGFSI